MDMSVDMDKHINMVMYMAIFLLFRFFLIVFECFAYIEKPKQTVSVLKKNNQNKRLVSESAKQVLVPVSVIETKLVS
jgi:hypothetical protein